jgi:hypothetical protein
VKLTEALKVLRRLPEGADPFSVELACGFSSLHLETFLAAHLQHDGRTESKRSEDVKRAKAAVAFRGDVLRGCLLPKIFWRS